MEDSRTDAPGARQIDAMEANRLAQELNRQADPAAPAFDPGEEQRAPGPEGEGSQQLPGRDVDGAQADLAASQGEAWPPRVDSGVTVGEGSPEERRALQEEERS